MTFGLTYDEYGSLSFRDRSLPWTLVLVRLSACCEGPSLLQDPDLPCLPHGLNPGLDWNPPPHGLQSVTRWLGKICNFQVCFLSSRKKKLLTADLLITLCLCFESLEMCSLDYTLGLIHPVYHCTHTLPSPPHVARGRITPFTVCKDLLFRTESFTHSCLHLHRLIGEN